VTKVVYHFPTESRGNFGRIVNGKSNFVSLNGNVHGKTEFLETWTKIPKQNFRMENVRSICLFSRVLGRSTWIAFDPIFREKVVEFPFGT